MTRIPDHFRMDFSPLPDPAAVVTGPSARFTVLTSRLLRLEFDPGEEFEDRPSQVFWHRQQSVPDFKSHLNDDCIEIETEHLRLEYLFKGAGFTRQNLSIRLKEDGHTWHFGDPPEGNLLGTTRTLDGAAGMTQLEPGLLSRDGWAVVDDSNSLVFNQDGWLELRGGSEEKLDLYFLGHGVDFRSCLRDYTRVAGSIPIVPRWALGNWWSRFWPYTQEELLGLMEDFQAHEVPLSVCVIDMDWHTTDTGNQSRGWTGYTWNRDLFHDPQGMVARFHDMGLRTALNLHPADGVHPHEDAYPQMAQRIGIDQGTKAPVPFDCTDPKFMRAYFELLHHPHEEMGIDFWWVDWQQGTETNLHGLDPLWWLNHLHFYDLGRHGTRRPFTFSRWGGLGNHRYPIGFSGDAIVDWESLAFQPYFTSTAANVGYGWWSHDIGGHMSGIETPELYARWVQFGVFSPIFRLHSTNTLFHDRRPWSHDAGTFHLVRDSMQLRHALIPYIYSMAWKNYKESIPLIRPMYHTFPECEEAYATPQQYTFGSELLAAPFVSPRDGSTGLSRQVVWLPEGEWFNFFTGEHYRGSRWAALYGALDDIPVFAKAGAIIPMAEKAGRGGVENPAGLTLHVFAGADNAFTLYEDDGETTGYLEGNYALTEFNLKWAERKLTFMIKPVSGDKSVVPPERTYKIILYGIKDPDKLELRIDGNLEEATASYNPEKEALALEGVSIQPDGELMLQVGLKRGNLLSKRDRTPEKLFAMLKSFEMESWDKHHVFIHLRDHPDDFEYLRKFVGHGMTPAQLRALFEVLRQAGVYHVDFTSEQAYWVLWNNNGDPGLQYILKQWPRHLFRWQDFPFEIEEEPATGFKVIRAELPPETASFRPGMSRGYQAKLIVNYDDFLTLEYHA